MDKVIVIGGKGSAVVIGEQIYDMQIKNGNVEFLGFAFDDENFGDSINGFPILCKTYEAYEKYKIYDDIKFIYQLYRPDLMKKRIDLLNSFRIPVNKFYTFIHQTATIAKSAKIGYGTAIMANTVVNSNAVIGNHCTIHSNSLIGHNTKMGSYNFVAAHSVVGSSSIIGDGNFFGLNSTFNNYIEIGDYNFVGMASNVVKGLDSNQKVYGNPAKEFYKDIKPL
jgi:sugar O-acyltransferase (sialic acid O-acetyltransferase NeuD family)